MANPQSHGQTINDSCLADFGLSIEMIRDAIEYTHNVLDQIDPVSCRKTSPKSPFSPTFMGFPVPWGV